ncbi:MAG: hypothetical protein QG670_2522 [Thermoproteota archaeon]|nr:hypothetical protein [Thermoproteota archaeon]
MINSKNSVIDRSSEILDDIIEPRFSRDNRARVRMLLDCLKNNEDLLMDFTSILELILSDPVMNRIIIHVISEEVSRKNDSKSSPELIE